MALQQIYSDIWEPFRLATPYGDTYFATFTDNYTWKSWVYLMKNRSQLRSVFIQFQTLVELETGLRIKAVRCDNASEYKSLGTLFERDYSVPFEYMTPYTPEQNRVSERLNRVLVTIARAMLLDTWLPLMFWGDAVTTASL